MWGNNRPGRVGVGHHETSFFWIGIGHAGTLISAISVPVPAKMENVDQPFGPKR